MGEDKEYSNAFKYIKDLVQNIRRDIDIEIHPGYRFLMSCCGIHIEVQFDPDEIDDFAIALDRYLNSGYFFTLENRILYRFCIVLGSKGLLDDIRISRMLAEEKGDWEKNIRVDVSFEEEFASILYDGLKLLEITLSDILSESIVEVPEMRNDLENVKYLLKYYEKNRHLSSAGAELQSLSYLKGAVICIIFSMESERERCLAGRVKIALNDKIYSLVSILRQDPFERVPPPECAKEFIIRQAQTATQVPFDSEKNVISPIQANNIENLLNLLDQRLVKRYRGAWKAFRSNNPDRLSQAANSMVELLDQVIGQTCQGTTLNDFLTDKFGSPEESKWVDVTRKWIAETKSNLHRIKHHKDYRSEQLTESLLKNAEGIMQLILNDGT